MHWEIITLITFVACVTTVGVAGLFLYVRPTRQSVGEWLGLIKGEDRVNAWSIFRMKAYMEYLGRLLTKDVKDFEEVTTVRNDCKVQVMRLVPPASNSPYYLFKIFPRVLEGEIWVEYNTDHFPRQARVCSKDFNKDIENEKIASALGKKPWEIGLIIKDPRRVKALREEFCLEYIGEIV